MFRITYLNLIDHPQLGEINIPLSLYERFGPKPFTSVIIGPNGTGKSFVLKTISDIFTQFHDYQRTNNRNINLPYSFRITYEVDGVMYEIVSYKKNDNGKERRTYLFYKNKPFLTSKDLDSESEEIFKEFEINLGELVFPNCVIVNSVMLNDRFTFKKSKSDSFYQYLGVRSTSSTASTKSAVKGVIEKLFTESLSNVNFLDNLRELLAFLEFKDAFEVEYNTKLKKLFFSGNLTVKDFKQYYEYWWDEDFSFSARKENNPIWSKPFYDNYYKGDETKIETIVDYLNELANSGRLVHKYNSTSKLFKVNFLDPFVDQSEFWKIIDLEKLDVINVNSIKLNKNDSNLNISDISSGEYHLLISLIGIFSKIKDNSLILIDEPEISLHPNWQMQYITFLKKVFAKCASCHFIITSHSHFLVSDLEGESSSVTALKRNKDNKLESSLIEADTFGWSAEDILYNVFNVRSTWNPFLEADLTELLGLISINSKNKNKIENLVAKFNKLPTRENDPLINIIKEANNYLTTI